MIMRQPARHSKSNYMFHHYTKNTKIRNIVAQFVVVEHKTGSVCMMTVQKYMLGNISVFSPTKLMTNN